MSIGTKKHIYFWERISFRILAGFFLPLAISCYVLFAVSSSFGDMRELRERRQSIWFSVRVNETTAILNLTRIGKTIGGMWDEHNDGHRPQLYLRSFEQNIQNVQDISGDEEAEGKRLYEAIGQTLKRGFVTLDQMTDSVRRGDHREWDRQKLQLDKNLIDLEKTVDRLSALHSLDEVKDLNQIATREHTFTSGLYYIIAAVAVFGFALGVFVTISIANPTKQLVLRLQDIATGEGDLTKRIDPRFTTGEMKEVAGWMNLFLDKTQSIIATIANAAIVIRRTTEKVAGFTNTNRVLAVSINKNMMTQSMNLDECSNSLDKIDDLLQASGDSSKQAASLSKIAMDRALQGGASVNETIEAMEKIEESADKVEVLVGSINEIAAQTNLLAINAAIEASKAGEHGKGFAVVAEEVRKLAERTRKLTGQVTALITESNGRVKTGVSLAKNAGVALDGIIKDVEAVSSLIQRIAASATKQTESSATLVAGMQKVTEGIRDNLRQMGQITETVEFTSGEVQRLDALVNELNTIVGQFKLEESKQSKVGQPDTVAFHDGEGSRSISMEESNNFTRIPAPLPKAPDTPPEMYLDDASGDQDVA